MLAVTVFICMQSMTDGSESLSLGVRINRRIYIHPSGLGLLGAESIFTFLPDFFDEVSIYRIIIGLLRIDTEVYLCLPGAVVLIISDIALFAHSVQHDVTPVERSLFIARGRIKARSLGQTGKQGALFKRQVFERFREVILRARLESV